MGTVTVIYSRTHSIGSVLIRAGAWWGPWSHCALVDGAQRWRAGLSGISPCQSYYNRGGQS
jgi:hypothetical protein